MGRVGWHILICAVTGCLYSLFESGWSQTCVLVIDCTSNLEASCHNEQVYRSDFNVGWRDVCEKFGKLFRDSFTESVLHSSIHILTCSGKVDEYFLTHWEIGFCVTVSGL
ncbi:hypothetical protein EG68_00385 [Paragonimus skrjabini miyazakii]|uniref:Secreted protein n=1 Tax=Paragonimus skrjabini miyazakii TaxID=59628 RepID=A0A8S9Z9J3_9TREM|nr:hypothetical protein EG68_00385 [Paragonimus skrjabini miyazakii]